MDCWDWIGQEYTRWFLTRRVCLNVFLSYFSISKLYYKTYKVHGPTPCIVKLTTWFFPCYICIATVDLAKFSAKSAQDCPQLYALQSRIVYMKFKIRMSLRQQWHSSKGVWNFTNGSMELSPSTIRLSVFSVSLSFPRTTTLEVHKTVSIPLWGVLIGVTPCSGSQCFLCKGCPIQSLSGTPIEACFQGRRRLILGPRPRSRRRSSRKQIRKLLASRYQILPKTGTTYRLI